MLPTDFMRLSILLLALAPVGCAIPNVASTGLGTGRVHAAYLPSEKAGPEASTTPPPVKPAENAAPPSCALTMQLVNNRSNGETRLISEPACLTLSDNAIGLPTAIKLWLADDSYNDYRVCQKGTITQVTDAVKSCTWNRTFRHGYPWTIKLSSRSDKPLVSFFKAARVFLNGDLVWTWVPQSDDTTREMWIPGQALTRQMEPEGAAIDFRIIPQGVDIDETLLAAKVETRPAQWRRQLEIAGDAVLTSPSLANGTLKTKLSCVVYRATLASYNASQIVGAKGQSPPVLPAGCPKDPDVSVPESLSARYADLKTKSAHEFGKEMENLEAALKVAVDEYSVKTKKEYEIDFAELEKRALEFYEGKGGPGTWWEELDGEGHDRTPTRKALLALIAAYPAVEKAIVSGHPEQVWAVKAPIEIPDDKLIPSTLPERDLLDWIATRGGIETLKRTLGHAHSVLKQGLGAIDETLLLQTQIRRDVVRIAKSTDEQARLFARVANSLQGTSPFEQFHDNPDVLPGELSLPMSYSDHVQWFWFAPWTGFPVDLDGEGDFTAANLIPIVDVLGLRYQWGRNRFSDARIGLGLTALSFTTKDPDPADPAAEEVETTQFRFAPEANVGIANLKVGISRATGGTDLTERERWRFIVGADLYKLISGSNLEAF